MVFCGTAETPTVADAGDADFVFVPHTMAAQVASLPLDLTVNMVSFQEMTDASGARLRRHGRRRRLPVALQLQPRSVAVQRARSRASPRRWPTAISSPRCRCSPTDYTTRPEEAAEGGQERRAIGVQLPAPGGTAGAVGPPTRPPKREARQAATGDAEPSTGGPRVVLGMTLYNKASHLRGSARLAARADVRRLPPGAARRCVRRRHRGDRARATPLRDPRITYLRHDTRQAMVATWREVAERACARVPLGPLLRLGERPRSLAPALARSAAGRDRGRSGHRAGLSDHAPHRPGRHRARKGAAALRHRRRDRGAGALVALLPRGHRLGRHGLRADAPSTRCAPRASSGRCCAPTGCSSPSCRCTVSSARCPRCCGSAATPRARAWTGSATRSSSRARSRSGSARRRGSSTPSPCGTTYVAGTPALGLSRTAWVTMLAQLPDHLRVAALPQDRGVARHRARHRQRDLGEEAHEALLASRGLCHAGRQPRGLGPRPASGTAWGVRGADAHASSRAARWRQRRHALRRRSSGRSSWPSSRPRC